MAGTITTTIGDGSTNHFVLHAVIVGTGIVSFGDSADVASSNASTAGATTSINWGWNNSGYRTLPVWNFDLTALLPRKITVARAYVRLLLSGKTVPGGYAYPGWTFSLHELEIAPGAGITWQLRGTALPWVGGYGPRPGFDYDSVAVGSTLVPAATFAALGTSGGSEPLDIDVTAAVQRAIDGKYPLRLVAPVPFSYAAGGNQFLSFINPNKTAAGVRTHLVVEYWPAIGVLTPNEAVSGRPADFSKLHNPAAAGTANRTYLDVVEQGTTSSAIKEWAWNFRKTGPRRHVIAGTSRAECDPVDNTGSVSGITLRYIYAYDYDTTPTPDTYAPEGKLTVEAVSGTTYRLGYTAPGGSITYLLEETTGLTNVTHAADHTFVYNSKWAFKIFTRDWSATTGANTSDRYYTNCRPDQRTTQSTETLGLVAIMPPTPDRFGNAGDTAKARRLSGAYTQQLWAAAADVNISGTTHTHVEVRNTSNTNWLEGEPVTLISGDGETVVESSIETVYSSTHGTYPQQIRLSTQLSAPELAAMTATATLTGGVYLGTFATNQVRTLASAVAIGDDELPLVTAFDGVPGNVQIVDSSTGYTQVVAVTSGTSTLQLSETLDYAFTAGSNVFAIINPSTSPGSMSGAPLFVEGIVPAAQAEGLYSGYYVFFERRTV